MNIATDPRRPQLDVVELVRDWPDKLLEVAGWLDVLDTTLDVMTLEKYQAGEVEFASKMAKARGPVEDRDRWQRDIRKLAHDLRAALSAMPTSVQERVLVGSAPDHAWCFAVRPGVAACGDQYEAITDRPENVTCDACRKTRIWSLLDPRFLPAREERS